MLTLDTSEDLTHKDSETQKSKRDKKDKMKAVFFLSDFKVYDGNLLKLLLLLFSTRNLTKFTATK